MKKILYTFFLSLFFLNAVAQKSILAKAEKEYNNYAYADAIEIYEKLAAKGYEDEKMFQRLGNAYYFNAELPKAAAWYDKLFALNAQQEPEYLYRYAQSLKSIGDYAKADKMLEVFNKKTNTDSRGILFENNKNYLEQIKLNSGRFEISSVNVNSESSDFGSAFLNNNLVFSSARKIGKAKGKTFKWTNKSFTNIYIAPIDADGNVYNPVLLNKEINSKFNESTPVFTKDGKTMYFTRNNYLDGKRGKDDKNITLLKLYKANLVDGNWVNITELPFNSDRYSTAHPALSLDEKRLYFASDMPGTFGQSDLFSVLINADGSYGRPENLGPSINTEGRETFPFISADNELYFATDGRPGLGGLDIVVSKILENGTFDQVQNIGEPVNTKFDDFAFIIDSNSRKGYFSSNKKGGAGSDDIYKFTETRKLVCERTLTGTVRDSRQGEKIEGAKVTLYDQNNKLLQEFITGTDGVYSFKVNCGQKYSVRVERKMYPVKENTILISAVLDNKLDFTLEKVNIAGIEMPELKTIKVGTDLAKTLNISMIYFDLGKWNITDAAEIELKKILAVMQEYPQMKIDIRSHTDSRSSAKSNLILSDKRAKSIVSWLVKNGVDSTRLRGKGYGESKLINKCKDGVKCSEAEHLLNRRSEFVILSM
ncbi:outer membrane protein OmpA-like peptidoglycan-associated protein/tetratricopeptide (TPR) repeat protein [Flavobacterium sp. SORGH_AS 622]|nr:outer membrane protein OmpA-like peptidoglycan-associated protein/tetratricopeptide (TPR) repeat protein [Flavobacterium sp. SORGH_AS_0622]